MSKKVNQSHYRPEVPGGFHEVKVTRLRHNVASSRNHCCGKAISITYSDSLSYPACKAHAPYYIVIGGLSGSIIFFVLSRKRHDFHSAGKASSSSVGATARGGPWPPLQYASRFLGPLLCLSIRLYPSFSGPWTRHPAISFLVFLFVLLRTAFRTASFFWDCGALHSFYMPKPSYSLAFNKPDNVLSLDYGF